MQEDKREITAAEAARIRPVDARKLAAVEGGFKHEEGKHTWADLDGELWPGSTGLNCRPHAVQMPIWPKNV